MEKSIYHDARAQWTVYGILFLALLLLPLFIDDPFQLNGVSRYLVFGMLAASVSLVWGFGGILTLGQGIGFGIAAYGMAMTMIVQGLHPLANPVPSFMRSSGVNELPWLWEPFWSTGVGILLTLAVPIAFTVVFGVLMFKARVAGAFIAIMTLAMLAALYNLSTVMDVYTSGVNGLSPRSPLELFGIALDPYERYTYWIIAGIFIALISLVKLALQTKFGLIVQATREDSERARYLGYNVSSYQILIFAIGGLMTAVAGGCYVILRQYVNPSAFDVTFSISMVVWAAVGGRLSLLGAVLGAFLINGAEDTFGDDYQAVWLLILGATFMLVVRFLPYGLVGLVELGFHRIAQAGGFSRLLNQQGVVPSALSSGDTDRANPAKSSPSYKE